MIKSLPMLIVIASLPKDCSFQSRNENVQVNNNVSKFGEQLKCSYDGSADRRGTTSWTRTVSVWRTGASSPSLMLRKHRRLVWSSGGNCYSLASFLLCWWLSLAGQTPQRIACDSYVENPGQNACLELHSMGLELFSKCHRTTWVENKSAKLHNGIGNVLRYVR